MAAELECLRELVRDLLPLAAISAQREAGQFAAMEREDQPAAVIIRRALAALTAIPIPAINNAQRALKTMRHTLLMRLHEQDLPPK